MSTIPEPLTRTLADRYRIEREIGRGGMATVYLADDLKHHRKVAIKVLHPERAAAIGQERFLREIEIAARLNHPHILPLHDSGAAGGHLFYVMPYIAGGPLRARLQREKQLPVEDALRIAREIASALGHAHQEGLVHRDIKPENVLISDGIALVADFGIARALSGTPGGSLTTAGGAIGTPAYMAPEQAMGGNVDGRADLYALACVLYEMLAGQPPFTGPDEGLFRQHLSVEPRTVTDLRPTVPQHLAESIARGLAKLPSDRFGTAARFTEALLSSTVPNTPTPHATEARAIMHNLPRQRTHFIGRERELAECARALGDTRVLTITGIGGCGKTRLALKLAESMIESFPDGVLYADFAPLKDADRVLLAVANALDVREEVGTPLIDKVKRFLREKPRTLIVLDNCEHLLTAVTDLVDELIASTGDLKVIVTSREGLGIEGERLFALRSLSVPPLTAGDARSVESSEAVRLFVDRAQVVDSRFALTETNAPAVAEICRRLDGIPLAIELAAARSKVLKVEDIASRLDDRFRLLTGGSKTALPRHQTLRAAIQWSYEQLTPDEQRLFRLLSVFTGGWTLEAATFVTGEGADEFEVLELMTRLVDKSLVTMDREAEGESRYSMLETVRQFAQDLLNVAGEGDTARTRHLDFYVSLMQTAEPELRTGAQAKWMARLSREQENILSAHAWTDRSQTHAEQGLRLAGTARRFWTSNGLFELGMRICLNALAQPGADRPTPARARALCAAAYHSYFQGKYDQGCALAEESLALARELNNPLSLRDALQISSMNLSGRGDTRAARAFGEELLELSKQLGEEHMVSTASTTLAELLRADGDLKGAQSLYEVSLQYGRKRGDRENEVVALINLASIAIPLGQLDRARDLLADAASNTDTLGQRNAAVVLSCGANWCAARGDCTLAARLYGASLTAFSRVGYELEPVDQKVREPLLANTREALGEAAFQAALAEGGTLGNKEALAQLRRCLETAP